MQNKMKTGQELIEALKNGKVRELFDDKNESNTLIIDFLEGFEYVSEERMNKILNSVKERN